MTETYGCTIYYNDFSEKALEFLKELGLNTIKIDASSNF